MFQKIVKVYKRSGLLGILLTSMSYEFKQASKFFSNSAERILTKIPISSNDKELLNRNHIFKKKTYRSLLFCDRQWSITKKTRFIILI